MKTPIDRICYFSNHVSMDERDTPFTTKTIEAGLRDTIYRRQQGLAFVER